MHECVSLPYELLDNNDFELAQLEEDDNKMWYSPVLKSQKTMMKDHGLKQPQEGEKPSKYRFNFRPWDLTEAEKYDMKVAISRELSRSPYAAVYALMPFIDKPTATFDTLTRFS